MNRNWYTEREHGLALARMVFRQGPWYRAKTLARALKRGTEIGFIDRGNDASGLEVVWPPPVEDDEWAAR